MPNALRCFSAVTIMREKESHLLEVCRYVVRNPVRAKRVKRPQDRSWSSYGGTAGLASARTQDAFPSLLRIKSLSKPGKEKQVKK